MTMMILTIYGHPVRHAEHGQAKYIRGCQHNQQGKEHNYFCDVCNKPMWVTELPNKQKKITADYLRDHGIPDLLSADGENIVYVKDARDTDEAFVGVVMNIIQDQHTAGRLPAMPPEVLTEAREVCQAFLEDIGQWDEEAFGIYVVKHFQKQGIYRGASTRERSLPSHIRNAPRQTGA